MPPRECFLSYPLVDSSAELVIRSAVLPGLKAANWFVSHPDTLSVSNEPVFESIIKAMRRADLVVAVLPRPNNNVLYELGIAHGWGKPTILLVRALETVPFDVASRFPVFVYSHDQRGLQHVRQQLVGLLSEFEREAPSLADPSIERYVDLQKTISIELLAPSPDAVPVFAFVHSVAESLQRIQPLERSVLAETRVGSFGTWISTAVTSIVSLAEKILFFVPEWQLKSAQRVRIEAEAELLRAQAERERAQSDAIRRSEDRKDVELFISVLDRAPITPARVTLGNVLRIEKAQDGTIVLGAPKKRRQLKRPESTV